MDWLKKHGLPIRVGVFVLMGITPVLLYAAAEAGLTGLVWALLAADAAGAAVLVFLPGAG